MTQPVEPKDVPWMVRGRKYVARGVNSSLSTSLHACVTVSPARLERERQHRRGGGERGGGGGRKIAHSHIAVPTPSAWRKQNDCLVKSTFLVRPGGLLAYLAVVVTFLFGVDVIAAYCEALLVRVMEDVKLCSEVESMDEKLDIVARNDVRELERLVKKKNEEVRSGEERKTRVRARGERRSAANITATRFARR